MIFSTDVGLAQDFIHEDLIYNETSINKIIDWVKNEHRQAKDLEYINENYERAAAMLNKNNYIKKYQDLISKLNKMKQKKILATLIGRLNKYPTFLKWKYKIYFIIGREIRDGLFYLNKLKPGDTAIDCGANIGKYTKMMMDKGAEVYAFEPNPYAFGELSKKFPGSNKVHCINKGVYTQNTTMPLYLHKNASEDQVKWSIGSSLLEYKGNINPKDYIVVGLIDLSGFINSLGREIKLVKMDVEGVECEIITSLIDSGAIKKIKWLLVEGHGKRIPEMRVKMDQLKDRIKKEKIKNIYFNWD